MRPFLVASVLVFRLHAVLPLNRDPMPRRGAIDGIAVGVLTVSFPCLADTIGSNSPNGLGSRLLQRDPSVLKNNVFNVPPKAQVYPDFCRGDWNVKSSFKGFLFPSKIISRDAVTSDFGIAGFQKCSIAATADVGKENVEYKWSVDAKSGLEERKSNFKSAIDGYLGYSAVKEVIYDASANPNRISIDFIDYKTVNAERIELFCNARESETYRASDDSLVFVCSESVRQVSFGTGNVAGIPRQVSTNYCNYWTWRQLSDGKMVGNLLTTAYLDPQDPLYFKEPTQPVAVYSHLLEARRIE